MFCSFEAPFGGRSTSLLLHPKWSRCESQQSSRDSQPQLAMVCHSVKALDCVDTEGRNPVCDGGLRRCQCVKVGEKVRHVVRVLSGANRVDIDESGRRTVIHHNLRGVEVTMDRSHRFRGRHLFDRGGDPVRP